MANPSDPHAHPSDPYFLMNSTVADLGVGLPHSVHLTCAQLVGWPSFEGLLTNMWSHDPTQVA